MPPNLAVVDSNLVNNRQSLLNFSYMISLCSRLNVGTIINSAGFQFPYAAEQGRLKWHVDLAVSVASGVT